MALPAIAVRFCILGMSSVKRANETPQQLLLRPTFDESLTSMSHNEAVETLAQLFPNRTRTDLARYLAASQNNVERAFAAIERGSLDHDVDRSTGARKKRKRTRANDDAGRIGAWLAPPPPPPPQASEDSAVLVLDDSDSDAAADPPPQASRRDAGPAVKSAFDLLKPRRGGDRATAAPASHVNLPPLTLRTADMSPNTLADSSRSSRMRCRRNSRVGCMSRWSRRVSERGRAKIHVRAQLRWRCATR